MCSFSSVVSNDRSRDTVLAKCLLHAVNEGRRGGFQQGKPRGQSVKKLKGRSGQKRGKIGGHELRCELRPL